MARRHGDRLIFRGRRRRYVGIEPLEARRLLSLPPALSVMQIFVAPMPIVPSPGFAAARDDVLEVTAVDLALPGTANNLVGAAVYRGGSTAEPPPVMPALDAKMQSVKDVSDAPRLSVSPAAEVSPPSEIEQKAAEDETAPAPATQPPPTQPVDDADRPAPFGDDGLRASTNIPDVTWQAQTHRGGNNVIAPGEAAVASVMDNGLVIADEASLEPAKVESKQAGNRTTAEVDNAVGYLVAFEQRGIRSTETAHELVQRSSAAVKAIIGDLLVPHMATDEAAIGSAIRELLADAEQVGVSLAGMFADPVQSAELAVATGVIAAGFVARQLRTREKRDREEARQMLAARFLAGPESVRLFRQQTSK